MSTQSPPQPQAAPAATSTPAGTQQQPTRPQLKWRYPFAPNNGNGTGSPQPYLDALGKAEDGFYPLGANGIWHGGIHFDRKTAGMLKQDAGVSAIADGEIVAYRLDRKYPELDYPDGHKALYSTGFVLVRHKLVMPAAPKSPSSTSTSPPSPASSTSPSASTETAPPADEVLEFYSLYMHLLDWEHYDSAQKEAATHKGTTAVEHMLYWKGEPKFIVGSKAHDKQTDSAGQHATGADPIGDLISNNFKPPTVIPSISGLHIRELPDSRCKILGILPQGSEITVAGAANKGWARISKVLKGAPVGKTAGEDAPPAAATGWVFLGELDSETIPSPLDAVVILDPPFPVKAGDRIGYPGHYLRYSDTSQLPPQASRPLLHLEVFAGDKLKVFIEKSAARAKNAPDSEKTMLVVSPGAKLVPLPKPAQAVAQGLKLKPVEGAPTSGLWTKVQPMRMPTSSAHGHGHGSTHQAQGTPEGSPLWVERNLAGQVVRAGGITGWSDFPLKIANAQGPAVTFQDVFTPGELQQLPSAQDDQKHKWWEITVGTGKGESATGWVCSKNHPNVAWQSPWEWPGFEIVDNTSVSIVDAFKRSLYVKRELFDSEDEEFKPAALDVSSSPLITKLEKAIDHDDNGTITAVELAQAQGTPWLAEALSHLIVRYESEWGGSMGKWDELSSLMKAHKGIWQTELERITKLQWWDKVSAVKGFPVSPVVYHLHPVGLIGNFINSAVGDRVLRLSDQDVDDLIKVTATEVALSLNDDDLAKQAGAVVDTILNRRMSGLKNWSTIRGVINERWQFSDINAPRPSAYGSVQNVPESRVSPRVRTVVIAHLQDRAEGGASLVGNNLSYANPYVLDEASAATRVWVEDVVHQASITGYRYGAGRAVHVHGTTQGLMSSRPAPYTIELPDSYSH